MSTSSLGQHPSQGLTHPSLHVRDAKDAFVVFEAVRRGILPLIQRRLTSAERQSLTSGNVYVWEEAETKGGLERWTDGRRWSQSRMRGEYLYYEEKVDTTPEEKEAKAARRAQRAANPFTQVIPPPRRSDRPSKPHGLTKQTYSTLVALPGSRVTRKWHIVAYFSGPEYVSLPTVESYDYLQQLKVPEGVFTSSKGPGKRFDSASWETDSSKTGRDVSPCWSEEHRPSSAGYAYGPTNQPPSPTLFRPRAARAQSYNMTQPRDLLWSPRPSPGNRAVFRQSSCDASALPRLSTLVDAPSSCSSTFTRQCGPSTHFGADACYTPLSKEDQRALGTFKVAL